jgi:type III secretion system YscQ/HrcQ family protein
VSIDGLEEDSTVLSPDPNRETSDDGPFGELPRLSSRQARLESRLARLETGEGFRPALGWLSEALGAEVKVGRAEVAWRAAGLRRAGLVAQLPWPRLGTRIAVGLETPIAHAIVDRLLGFDRLSAESRLPLSPVEWGILTYAVAETASRLLASGRGPLGSWDLSLDRVGPDPFEVAGLGRVVTIRWPLRLGTIDGSVRLWLSEALVERWLLAEPPVRPEEASAARFSNLTSAWRAEAGTIALPRGLKTLRLGGVLPLIDSRLRGTPISPSGPVELTLSLAGHGGLCRISAEAVPLSGGGRLTVIEPLRHEPTPREGLAMTASGSPASPEPSPSPAPTDVPVTLVVELGRVNLSLGRLADLRPGDVVELGRHSREPIELTSGGRLVARGELVQIDTELGVRVTQVYL